ncbi:hypothetical protein [Caulobacter segnis]|uniref:hypothetical protein n=1 Tax=Caulobacter segnis TaxID=88688 RepID=UPI0028649B8E|nr:hypothetical protein [Caulobacter segnis]MDR6624838.1 hypothetical protein [Caulobacter segnis]
MTAVTTARLGLVLGVHPHAHGFGWAAFDGPLSLYDWETARARGNKNEVAFQRFERLLDRLAPLTVVFEAFEGRGAMRSPRVVRLCRAMVAATAVRGIEVAVYSRGDIRASFAHLGAVSRYETAQVIATLFEPLRPTLPARRSAWAADDQRLGIFNAVAAVLTHFQRDAQTFLDSLARR